MNGNALRQFLKTPAGLVLVLTGLALVAVAVYLPTIEYDFVWDDTSLITGNRSLAEARPWQLFSRGFWYGAEDPPEGPSESYYRPLASLSFWADLKLAGANPGWFHLVNVLLNALVVLLVALITRELFGTVAGLEAQDRSTFWAGIAGLLFAMHSSHVEAVAFVAGRTDLLLALFVSLAMFGLVRGLRKRQPAWFLLVPAGYLLALLSKETAVLFPLVAAVVLVLVRPLPVSDAPPAAGDGGRGAGTRIECESEPGTGLNRRCWLSIGACVPIAATWWLLRSGAVGPGLPFAAGPGLPARLSELANDFGLYLRIFAWPFRHQAKFPADPAFNQLTPYALAALLFLVTIPLLAARRQYRVAFVGFAWTVAFLLPVINIFPLGPQAAERLLYLPSVGLILTLVTLTARGLSGIRRFRVFAALLLLVFSIALGIDTLLRSRIWRNELRLYSAMVREAPDAPGPYFNLANVVAPTDPDSALALYYKALARDQGHVRSHINVGILQSRLGDHRQSVHHFRIAREFRPNSQQVLNNLGLAFLAAGRPDSALAYLTRALAVDSATSAILLNRSIALHAVGFPDSADLELRRLLERDPGFVPAYLVFAERFERRGLSDSAVRYLSRVSAVEPDRPEHHNRLGTVLTSVGDSAAAAESYARALALNPDFIPALFNQAILTAARGDTAAAARLAERAWRLRPDIAAVAELYQLLSGKESHR